MKSLLLRPYYIIKARSKRRQVEDETKILQLLREDTDKWWHGYDLHKATGLRSGRMYMALGRLEQAKMLNIEWEKAAVPKRYKRRIYRLDRKRSK